MFMQSYCWNYSLDFQTSFGIGKVSRERKKMKANKVKRSKGISCQPSSNLRDHTETSSHSICHPPSQ